MAEKLTSDKGGTAKAGGLALSKEMAVRLSVTARKLRLSTSSRGALYKAVGLRPRLSERLFYWATIIAVVVCFAIPNIVSVLYYGFLASDQYVAEARFTVRSSTPAMGKDQFAKITGIPQAKIVQDTQMVANYIQSSEMLDLLEKRIDLHALYSNSDIDFWARLPEDAPIEKRLKYWSHMAAPTISPSSGIVTVTVRAFTPEDSVRILNEVLSASERMVNGVNDRMWADITDTMQTNLDSATVKLRKAREELQAGRNQSGVLTIESSSQIVSALISKVEAERLELQQRYDTQINEISADAPQMRVLRREIASKEKQVEELRSQLTGQSASTRNLADISLDLSQLQLAETLAIQQFTTSVAALEQVRFTSSQQLLYLDSFLKPRLPEESRYPHRMFWIISIALMSIVGCGIAVGLLRLLRIHLLQ